MSHVYVPATSESFFGVVETTEDALRLVQAAISGLIPRINHRPYDSERRAMIRSGAVFIFEERESGITRWTDGLLWSESRAVGSFLVGVIVVQRGRRGLTSTLAGI